MDYRDNAKPGSNTLAAHTQTAADIAAGHHPEKIAILQGAATAGLRPARMPIPQEVYAILPQE